MQPQNVLRLSEEYVVSQFVQFVNYKTSLNMSWAYCIMCSKMYTATYYIHMIVFISANPWD